MNENKTNNSSVAIPEQMMVHFLFAPAVHKLQNVKIKRDKFLPKKLRRQKKKPRRMKNFISFVYK